MNGIMRLSGSNRSNLQVQAALTAMTDVIKESVWFVFVYCFFIVGSVKILQWQFVIFVGEELTVFGFVREEYEKTLRTTGLLYPIHVHQGSPKYGRGANPSCEAISSDRKDILSIMKKYINETFVDSVEHNISRNNYIT